MMWNVDTMFDQEFIIYYELLVWLSKFYNYIMVAEVSIISKAWP